MTEPDTPSPLSGLPPDLAELDAELTRFAASERPSFAPELESELSTLWSHSPAEPRRPPLRRRLAAVTLAGLVVTAVVLPPARASVAQGMGRLLDSFRGPPPTLFVTTEAPTAPWTPDPVPARLGRASRPPTPPPPTEVVESPSELPAFLPIRISYPTLIDEDAGRRLIQEHYPADLQRGGIGGTVRLLFWVGEDGTVDQLSVKESSGVDALDRAALEGAASLRFHPATRSGNPVGTWVEFDLVFTPGDAEWVAPQIEPIAAPAAPDIGQWILPEAGPHGVVVPRGLRIEARELLLLAIGDREEAIEQRVGPLEGLLAGEPPAGASPMAWRRDAIRELERAIVRDPDNPAPPLALARIRRRQGLRAEARTLLTGGLERVARKTRPVSPQLIAELAFELGDITREIWRSRDGLGVVPEAAVDALACARRDPSDSTIETLVAWNFVCPTATEGVLHTEFQPLEVGERDREWMIEHFREAIDADPAHVGANVALLLEEAGNGRWLEVLTGARRFVAASRGHPYGHLLEGLALQRMRRSEEAAVAFAQAFAALGPETTRDLRDPSRIGVGTGAGADEGDPWATLDPILLTEVNEREIEHLARAAHAYLLVGDLDSDGARIWLRYGPPLAVRSLGTTKVRTEFWDYGPGPDFTFTRAGGATVRRFTSEAAIYADELEGVFPHWYGTHARALYTLPGQVARRRGSTPGEWMVEVHFEVPGALRQQPGDSVEVGLFLIGTDGTHRRVEHRWTRDTAIALQATYGGDVDQVVIEVHDPATHQAAGLRVAATLPEDPESWTALSDLLLLDPAEGTGADDEQRSGTPLTATELRFGEPVAITFEMREPEADAWRVWVEIDSETRDLRQVVPSRAERGAAFRSTHHRTLGVEGEPVEPGSGERPRTPVTLRGGVVRETLEIDLTRVPPDSYLLRVVVEAEGGRRVQRELPVRVRAGEGAARPPLAPPPPPFSGW